jgi:hypothetical protein
MPAFGRAREVSGVTSVVLAALAAGCSFLFVFLVAMSDNLEPKVQVDLFRFVTPLPFQRLSGSQRT